jgi:protease I
MPDVLQGKKIAFLMANEGVEEVELTEPLKAVRAAGADADLLAPDPGEIQAFNHLDKGDTFSVDRTVADADVGEYDGLVLRAASPTPTSCGPKRRRSGSFVPSSTPASRSV